VWRDASPNPALLYEDSMDMHRARITEQPWLPAQAGETRAILNDDIDEGMRI